MQGRGPDLSPQSPRCILCLAFGHFCLKITFVPASLNIYTHNITQYRERGRCVREHCIWFNILPLTSKGPCERRRTCSLLPAFFAPQVMARADDAKEILTVHVRDTGRAHRFCKGWDPRRVPTVSRFSVCSGFSGDSVGRKPRYGGLC